MTTAAPPTVAPPASLDPTAHRAAWCKWLGAQLGRSWPGLAVERVAQTGSTNTDLLERVRASGGGPVAATLLMADGQHAGRGRRGHHWQSVPGRSLTCSLALPLEAADWSGLSLAVGVALADALEVPTSTLTSTSTSPWRVGLKWPNDLWLVDADGSGRKLGGVLIESLPLRHERIAVIGFGINVLPHAVSDASTGFACWQEVDLEANPEHVLERVAAPLLRALRRFERDGFGAFAERFAARDVLCGRVVRTSAPVLEGRVVGVSARGALRLDTADGMREIESGEVSVRPVDAAAPASMATAATARRTAGVDTRPPIDA